MPTQRLFVGPSSGFNDPDLGPITGFDVFSAGMVVSPSDFGTALSGAGSVSTTTTVAQETAQGALGFVDDFVIPPTATIVSVRFGLRFSCAGLEMVANDLAISMISEPASQAVLIHLGPGRGGDPTIFDTPLAEFYSDALTDNPLTGVPWIRADIGTDPSAWGQAPSWAAFISVAIDADLGPPLIPGELFWDLVFIDVVYTTGITSQGEISQLPIEVAYAAAVTAPLAKGRTTLLLPAINGSVTLHVHIPAVKPGTRLTLGPCETTVTAVNGDVLTIDPPLCTDTDTRVPVGWDNDPGWEILTVNHGQCACCGEAITSTVTGDVGTGAPMSTVAVVIPFGAGVAQFFDAIGAPLSNGFLYAYAAGSTDPLDTFSDAALTVANDNPVPLDDEGRAVVYLSPAVYKFDLQDADHVSQDGFPRDNIAGSVFPGRLAGAVTLSPAANASANGHQLQATINKAATGTHALFAGFYVAIPTIGVGGATLTESASMVIQGAPLVGSALYALHVLAGLARFARLLPDSYTFATLPASPVVGELANVSDSNTVTWGANVAGGGSSKVLARWNGTNWTVVGK